MTRTVLLTGASRGLGRAAAERFASRGWNVAATMRDPAAGTISPSDGIRVLRLDVTDPASVRRAVGETLDTFGRIDVVVNNAGHGAFGLFEETADAAIRAHFDTNVFGALDVIRAVLPSLRDQGEGHIINVGSAAGRLGVPLQASYCATKWALNGFSEALAFELSDQGIHVSTFEPGGIATGFPGAMRVERDHPIAALDDYWARRHRRLEKVARRFPSFATSPEKVAERLVRLAERRHPPLRVRPTKDAVVLDGLRRIMPLRLFRRLSSVGL